MRSGIFEGTPVYDIVRVGRDQRRYSAFTAARFARSRLPVIESEQGSEISGE
jgi:hypothetical protein